MLDCLDLLTPIIEHNPYKGELPGDLVMRCIALADALEETGRVHGPTWLRTVRLWGTRKRRFERTWAGLSFSRHGDESEVFNIYLWQPFPEPKPYTGKPIIGQGWESELLWELHNRFKLTCPLCNGDSKGGPFYCPRCQQRGWVLAADEQALHGPGGHKTHDLAPVEREIEREMRYSDSFEEEFEA
jgi:hypothetical protein